MREKAEDFALSGRRLRVNWRDAAVRDALRGALAHRILPEGGERPDLVLEVARAEIPARQGRKDGLQVSESGGEWEVVEPGRGLASKLSRDGTRAWLGCADPSRLSLGDRSAPFRLILQRWLGGHGVHLLHAASVGWPGRGAVLLVAPGGGGKSNTALACLAHSPLQLLGEDFVAVDEQSVPRVWSLYCSAKLAPADLVRFPELAVAADKPDPVEAKLAFDLGTRHGDRFGDGLPVRAILVLGFADGTPSALRPAAAGDAVRAMLTSLLMVLPSARRPQFEFVTRLCARVPVYRLELGHDPRGVAAVIAEFLRT